MSVSQSFRPPPPSRRGTPVRRLGEHRAMSKRHRLEFTGLFSRNIWMIIIANALGERGPFLGIRDLLSPLYWLRLGFGADMVGTVFATGALSFCVSSLPGGALGSRLGRPPHHGPRRDHRRHRPDHVAGRPGHPWVMAHALAARQPGDCHRGMVVLCRQHGGGLGCAHRRRPIARPPMP